MNIQTLFLTLLLFVFISSSYCENTPADISDSPTAPVIFRWNYFALLDDTNPESDDIGCQKGYLPLPTDFKLADSKNPTHRAVLRFGGGWGTSCVVFGDGVSLSTTGEVCGQDQLLKKLTQNNTQTYAVKECDQRILIYQEIPPHPIKEFSATDIIQKTETTKYDWLTEGSTSVLRLTTGAVEFHINIFSSGNYLSWEGFTLSFSCTGTKSSGKDELGVQVKVEYSLGEPSQVDGVFDCSGTTQTINVYTETHRYPQNKYVKNYSIQFTADNTVKISKLWAYPLPENMLKNPSFESNYSNVIPSWNQINSYMPSAEVRTHSGCNATSCPWGSALVFNQYHNMDHGVSQEVKLLELYHEHTIYIGGWSKAVTVSGVPDDNYCIWVDAKSNSTNAKNVLILPFNTGSHDWEYVEGVITLPKEETISSLIIYGLFRNHKGLVFFDDFMVMLGLPPLQLTKHIFDTHAAAFGDPNIITFNREFYAFNAVGNYIMTKSSTKQNAANVNYEIQCMMENISPLAATITGVAGKIGSHTFSISSTTGFQKPSCYLDGQPSDLLETGGTHFFHDSGFVNVRGSLTHAPHTLFISLRFKDILYLRVQIYAAHKEDEHQSIYLKVSATSYVAGETTGLMGSEGDQSLAFGGSTEDYVNTNSYTNYTNEKLIEFANSWKASDSTLFVNHKGVEINKTVNLDVTKKARNYYEAICKTQHISKKLLSACIMDLAKHITVRNYHQFETLLDGGGSKFEESKLDELLNRHHLEQIDKVFYENLMIGVVVVFVLVAIAAFFIVMMSRARKAKRNYQMVPMENVSSPNPRH